MHVEVGAMPSVGLETRSSRPVPDCMSVAEHWCAEVVAALAEVRTVVPRAT